MSNVHTGTHHALGGYANDPRIEPDHHRGGYLVDTDTGQCRLVADGTRWELTRAATGNLVAAGYDVELVLHGVLGEPEAAR